MLKKIAHSGDVAAPKIIKLVGVRAWLAIPFAWPFVEDSLGIDPNAYPLCRKEREAFSLSLLFYVVLRSIWLIKLNMSRKCNKVKTSKAMTSVMRTAVSEVEKQY